MPDYRHNIECPHCPFCHATYTSKSERRPTVKCPMCKGNGKTAQEITLTIDDRLEKLTKLRDVENLTQLMDMLPDSYYEFEIRIRLRKLR